MATKFVVKIGNNSVVGENMPNETYSILTPKREIIISNITVKGKQAMFSKSH